MKKQNKTLIRVFSLLLAMLLLFVSSVPAAAAPEYMYARNKKQTAAAIRYLNDTYLPNGAAFALAQEFGSRADQALLAALCEKIVAGCKTDAEKAYAIANWVNDNVAYDMNYEMVSYPIDVYYEGRAVCYGFAMMISRLMRFAGIPAVQLSGMRGDMKNSVTVANFKTMLEGFSHAWVMAYYDKAWRLFDPVFNTIDVTSVDEMASWYFCNDIEGVAPYYKGMDMFLTNNGLGIFPVNGRLMLYSDGQTGNISGFTQFRNGMNLSANCVIRTENSVDGLNYVDSPERKDEMLNGQVYTDGLLQYSDMELCYYVNKNGIRRSCTVAVFDNALYAVGQSGNHFLLHNAGARQFYAGRPTVNVGEKVKLGVMWFHADSPRKMNVKWISRDPKTASVDKNGVVTVLAPGDIVIDVEMRYADNESGGANLTERYYLWGAKEKRVCAGSYALKEAELPVPNDVDLDGKLTTEDARAALRAALELDSLGIVAKNAADLDADGRITTEDARLLLRAALGLLDL